MDPTPMRRSLQFIAFIRSGITLDVKGKHNLKFGGEYRWYISPQAVTQRARADYPFIKLAEYYFWRIRRVASEGKIRKFGGLPCFAPAFRVLKQSSR